MKRETMLKHSTKQTNKIAGAQIKLNEMAVAKWTKCPVQANELTPKSPDK